MSPIDLLKTTTTLYVALPPAPTGSEASATLSAAMAEASDEGAAAAIESVPEVIPLREAMRSAIESYMPHGFTVLFFLFLAWVFYRNTSITLELAYVDGLRYLHQRIDELHQRLDHDNRQWAQRLEVEPIATFERQQHDTPFGWNLNCRLSSRQQPPPPPPSHAQTCTREQEMRQTSSASASRPQSNRETSSRSHDGQTSQPSNTEHQSSGDRQPGTGEEPDAPLLS
ncbi:hypothetical protein A1Q2_03583 [Trichosporon asahii var. asahii CBS 8904]|uniref:Uncharacterized protein n=1 Tax=Trichosporon asahii var. asahii (strain CBS 8904) TaxID=1220162 RepID=K1VNN0_TRIAC|nr:hypothetical protein A1Q2_03583 [Trichosporon asahii var. asahii CBS 8904]